MTRPGEPRADGAPAGSLDVGEPATQAQRPTAVGSAPEVDGGQVQPPEPVLATRNRIIGWATDLGTPTTLVLLRHGETAGSVAKLFSGRGGYDHGLTDLGRQQAQLAAQSVLARGGVTAVVSSTLRRCRETAGVAAAVLGLDVTYDDDLAEAGFGEWDGLTYEQVEQRWSVELADWLGSTSVAPPGGESMDAVDARVGRVRDRILADHPGEAVLVVAHVNPIKCLVRTALGAPPTAIYHLAMSPASSSEIDYYPDGTTVLRSFGVAAHLAGVASVHGG